MIEYLKNNLFNAQLLTGTFTENQLRNCGTNKIAINQLQSGYFAPIFIFLSFELSNRNSLNNLTFSYSGLSYIAQFPVLNGGVIYQTIHHPVNTANLSPNDTFFASGNSNDAGLLGTINYRIYYVQIDSI